MFELRNLRDASAEKQSSCPSSPPPFLAAPPPVPVIPPPATGVMGGNEYSCLNIIGLCHRYHVVLPFQEMCFVLQVYIITLRTCLHPALHRDSGGSLRC